MRATVSTAPNPKKTKARRSCRRLIGFGTDKLNKHPTEYAVGCLFLTFREAEYIVPRKARVYRFVCQANNISYRRQPIYHATSADGATPRTNRIIHLNFAYVLNLSGLRPLRRSRDMPSARYILRTRYILRIRYVPQAERVFYQKKFRPKAEFFIIYYLFLRS